MRREVLDKGFVELVDKMGNDYSILRAARVSTGSDVSKGDVKDRGLIRYLYRNDHISPFAFVSFQFHVKCPIFVARQWFRHRTFDMNEASARYKEFEWECFVPESWRIQDSKNKQASNEIVETDFQDTIDDLYTSLDGVYGVAKTFYEEALDLDIAREQARTVMPVGQYTEFFAHINLRNLFHFLELRADEHAQKEIRVYAETIIDMLSEIDDIKWSMEVFKEVKGLKTAFRQAMDKAFRDKECSIAELEQHLNHFG